MFLVHRDAPNGCGHAGADVTHSRSFDTSEPSVAAVVGSINPSCTRYAAQIKLQGHRVEMVQVRLALALALMLTYRRDSTLG